MLLSILRLHNWLCLFVLEHEARFGTGVIAIVGSNALLSQVYVKKSKKRKHKDIPGEL